MFESEKEKFLSKLFHILIICRNFSSSSFCRQISLDCMFLQSQQIIDYSLLLGLHFIVPENLKAISQPPGTMHNHENLATGDGRHLFMIQLPLKWTCNFFYIFKLLTFFWYLPHLVMWIVFWLMISLASNTNIQYSFVHTASSYESL